MAARILSGKTIAEAIKDETAVGITEFIRANGTAPGLAVVRVGEDPASSVYVANKVRTAKDIGLRSEHHHLSAEVGHSELLAVVNELNGRHDIDGILVQLPLPPQIDEREILETIDPEKDVDGFHPINVGRLSQGYEALEPCTPAGVI